MDTRFAFTPLSSALYEPLSSEARLIIESGATEAPHSGAYNDFNEMGTYYCARCSSPLYRSEAKFDARCGWPAFDDELPEMVIRRPDPDGRRTEIICATCEGHLGHVFVGEGFTATNTRHCVNSRAMRFVNGDPEAIAIFAGGCFWGVEHLFRNLDGVIAAKSGYSGGTTENPSYEEVCNGIGGHLEVVRITYNPLSVTYEELCKFFFEIHDPTQADGQGPDIGEQYLSAIFYRSRSEFVTALSLIKRLEATGLQVATQLRAAAPFYLAEAYHQEYYRRTGAQPYCHRYTPRF